MFRQPRRIVVALMAVALMACASPEERAAAYLEKAQEHFDAADYTKAQVEARNAVQIQPKNAKARYLLALVAEQKGETASMLENLAVVAEEDPQNAGARVKLGTLLLYAQDYAGAAMLAEDALKLTPDDPGVHVLKGRLALQKQDLDATLASLGRAIELDPKNKDAAALRGAALALRNADEALADLDASIERIGRQESEPLRQLRVDLLAGLKRNDQVEQELRALAKEFGRIVYFENLAVLYTSLGRLDAAEQVMRDAVAADPANVEAKVKLAQFQSRYRQQPAEAERTLKQFVADAPDNQQLLVYLGNFYEAGNRLDEARQTYEQAAEKGKKTSDGLNARNRLAALLIRAGQVPEALESLNDILEDEPDNLAALLARGEIHFAAGRSDEAVADFRGVLRREPENAVGLVLMARTHEARGDRPLAEDAYRRLLQAQPDNVEALTGLANLIGSAGQLDEAIKLFEQAAAAEPDSVAALAGLVAVRLEKGDLKDAEATARRFAALDDAQGTGQRELGRVLEAQGRLEEANQAFRKALLKKPDSSLALEGVVRTMQLRGQYPVATAFLTEHLEQYPDHVLARVLLGGNHLRAGQLVEARAALNQAIDQQPGLPRAYMVLAAAYPADPAARIKTYEQGIAANPTAGPLVQLLAGEHVAAGRPADAIKVYESQLDKDGMGPEVANNLAALLLDSREDAASHERALEIAQRFANSMSPMHLDTLGWAYYRTKDYPSAVRFLELAVAYGKSEPEARYHLAMAYLASDNATGARLELEKAVKEARPQAPWLAEARKTLASLSEKKAATG